MHRYTVGQRKAKDKVKRIDGYSYAFMTNITADEANWTQTINIVTAIIDDVFGLYDERDLEFELDIPSGQYAVRFATGKDLTEDAYAANVGKNENGIYAVQIPLSDDTDSEQE